MKHSLLLAITLLIALSAVVFSQQETSKEKGIPTKALEAFKKTYPNASINKFEMERLQGKIAVKIESVEGTTARTVTYDTLGTVLMSREPILPVDLPPNVRASIDNVYPRRGIDRAEKLFENGAVKYEVYLKLLYGSDGDEIVK
ncbi:MAG TPA: hypothetical protein VLY03_12555 [Bacteroidota bacterium]|nr:hypothetical protein [Bacteroidota bacterium]